MLPTHHWASIIGKGILLLSGHFKLWINSNQAYDRYFFALFLNAWQSPLSVVCLECWHTLFQVKDLILQESYSFFDSTFWYAILITFSFNFEILSINKEHSLSFQEGILIHWTRQSHHSLSPSIALLLAIKQGHASGCCSIQDEGQQQDHRRG